ncbi:Uncharacterised protein [Enterobacter hormaechei]|nr:hypothetical protein L359_07460 [Enterobacter hormaechei subsp. hoffmannii MGH 13]EUM93653.1 hypothetical protein L350_06754 [Enterobacter sp. MGH 4]VAE10752.1 Uncharacterised protein [Enterobacter hormaechei]VAF50895.1 Uncharacterised protein [Enterobacter hormaechei]
MIFPARTNETLAGKFNIESSSGTRCWTFVPRVVR